MSKIIDFNTYTNNSNKNNIYDLTTEDIFNIFLIFKHKSEIFTKFDINVLMQSLVKCKKNRQI